MSLLFRLRGSVVFAAAALGLAGLGAAAVTQPLISTAFVPVGVSYPVSGSEDREMAAADAEAIRTIGFTTVRLTMSWAEIEGSRGQYRWGALDRSLDLFEASGLDSMLALDPYRAPAWLVETYPDSPFRGTDGKPTPRICLDHPEARAAVLALVSAVTERIARRRSWRALEIDVDTNATLCTCPHTDRRRRAWSKAVTTQGERAARDAREAFASDAARDDLEALMAAQRATPARLKSTFVDVPDGQSLLVRHRTLVNSVDIYGLAVPGVAPARSRSWGDEAFDFDRVRSASGDKGWLLMAAEGTQSRLSTWSAWSRGARGVFFGPWRSSNGRAGGLVNADGTLTDRASVTGALARVIGRNTALFAPLRPRGSAVAIAVDDHGSGQRPSFVYGALLDRNIQADVIDASQIAEGAAERYRVVVDAAVERRPSLLAALSAYAKAGGIVIAADTVATPDALVQGLTRQNVTPDVRVEGSSGGIETRFLESASVVMFIALNHAATPQRVRFRFSPDTQEAIWQNMETGTSVNFVAGPDGPTYTYGFGPRDALVLMIRKDVR